MAACEESTARLGATDSLKSVSHVTGNMHAVSTAWHHSCDQNSAVKFSEILSGIAWELLLDMATRQSHIQVWYFAIATRLAAGLRTGVVAWVKESFAGLRAFEGFVQDVGVAFSHATVPTSCKSSILTSVLTCLGCSCRA